MSTAQLSKKTEDWTGRQKALVIAVVLPGFVVMVVSLGTSIPTGHENQKKASAFVQEMFPERALRPGKSSADAVAVVFHLIRAAEPEVARRAIGFAAEQRFGYAAPYVIQRLGSGDPALEEAAQDYLRTIAGDDYGPGARSWRAWWRNPPRNLLGVVVGETTFALAVPIVTALSGVLLLKIGGHRRRATAALVGGVLLALAWFMIFNLSMVRLAGGHNTCTFGPARITYYSDHGVVIGLEDARFGEVGVVFGLLAAFMILPLVFCALYFRIAAWLRPAAAPSGSDR
jgi:hypothetical protein